MKELLRRLSSRPLLAAELLLATLAVTVLNLASPLYVIQILNRYVTFGFDGTLYTLTSGMLIAVALLFAFRAVRTRIALAVSAGPDDALAASVFTALSRVRTSALDSVSRPRAQELTGRLGQLHVAYDSSSLLALMDAPFSLLYVGVCFLLSPSLALIGLCGMALMLLSGGLALTATERPGRELAEVGAAQRGHAAAALHGSDTVRAFLGGNYLREIWAAQIARAGELRAELSARLQRFQSLSGTGLVIMNVLIYAFGARQVVDGELTVGALIAVNILTSRAVQNMTALARAISRLRRAAEARAEIEEFLALPLEADQGIAMPGYSGRLALRDVSFAYPGSSGPLFESLNLTLDPGTVLVANGYNGSGKTTLARILAGLLDPSRGEILADGVNLRQIAPSWWRTQIIYLPQEPTFLNASIRDNLLLLRPDMDDAGLNALINSAGLARFLHTSPKGLETEVTELGRSLPLGIRRRLALARALASDGPLVILDEPTEGLDAEGCRAVYALMNRFAREGKTIIAFTDDPGIIRGAHLHLDLGVKPVPRLEQVNGSPPPAAAGSSPDPSGDHDAHAGPAGQSRSNADIGGADGGTPPDRAAARPDHSGDEEGSDD